MCDKCEQEQKRQAVRDYENRPKQDRNGVGQMFDTVGGFAATEPARPATETEVQDAILTRVLRRLDYHAPSRNQIPRYQAIRDAAKAFVTVIVRNTPQHSDESRAVVQVVEQAVMLANKAIALENE